MVAGWLVAGLLVATAGVGRLALRESRTAVTLRRLGAAPPRERSAALPPPIGRDPAPPGGGPPSGELTAACALVAAGAVAATAVLGGPALTVIFLATLAGSGVGLRWWTARRRALAAETALPGVLEDVARSLRSGASLGDALGETAERAGPLQPELQAISAARANGVPLVDALAAWRSRTESASVRLAVAALSLGAESGGPQARAVDGVAASLRDRHAVDREIRALSSQARASATVIAVAPVAFTAFTVTTDSASSHFLFRTPAGLACLTGGLLLDGVAAIWMARLTRPTA